MHNSNEWHKQRDLKFMTDPYEYLFNKLGIKIVRENPDNVTMSVFRGTNQLDSYIPEYWSINQLYNYYRTLNNNSIFRYMNQDLDNFCRLLNHFPRKLTSQNHVDLLLTLHGINKEA